jgi:hypothetical protein
VVSAIGIIISAILIVENNIPIIRYVDTSSITTYSSDVVDICKYQPIMYNAEIYPGSYDKIQHIYWLYLPGQPANKNRLRATNGLSHKLPILGAQLFKSSRRMRPLRISYENREKNKFISVWKNYEMSLDVDTLTPITKKFSTYILQEYFIPLDNISKYIPRMTSIFEHYNVNILNISRRIYIILFG